MSMIKKWRKVIPKKSETKYVSTLPKILNGPSLLTWRSATSSIIFGPFKLLGNAHLFNWLFRWLVGIDMWYRSCRPEVRIWRRIREKIRRISNLLKTFEVRTLSNLNANFVTSLNVMCITFCYSMVHCFWCRGTVHGTELYMTVGPNTPFWLCGCWSTFNLNLCCFPSQLNFISVVCMLAIALLPCGFYAVFLRHLLTLL